MTVEIRFTYFENPMHKAYIARILKRFEALYPTWLRVLTITITDTLPKSGSLLWAIGKPEYGTATIVIVSRWLDRDPELQRLDLLHEVLHVAHRREYSFVQSQLLDPIEDQDKKLHGYLVEDYRVRNEEFIEGIAQGIRALLGETEKEKAMHEQEICCRGCGRGLTAFEHQAASVCAKCGRGPYCSRCDGNHAENCQKPFAEETWNCAGCGRDFQRALSGWRCPKCGERWLCVNCAEKHLRRCPKINGFVCKLCGQNFAVLADFTMHAETCVRPDAGTIQICESCKKDIPLDQDAVFKDKKIYCLACWDRIACGGCYELFGEDDEVGGFDGKRFHLKCQPVRPQEPSKASGNQGVPPVPDQKRVPEEAKPMVAGYLELSELVFKHCPNNPERIHALRTLHESMQTAISSIVCADAWQTPKGD